MNNPFYGDDVSKEFLKESNAIKRKSAYAVLKMQKKQLKELKARKKMLEKKLKRVGSAQRREVEDLLSGLNRQISNLAADVNRYAAELISIKRTSKVAERIVSKMGYGNVDVYLRDNGFIDGKYVGQERTFGDATFGMDRKKFVVADDYKGNYMISDSNVHTNITAIKDPKIIRKYGNLAMEVNSILEENQESHKSRR